MVNGSGGEPSDGEDSDRMKEDLVTTFKWYNKTVARQVLEESDDHKRKIHSGPSYKVMLWRSAEIVRKHSKSEEKVPGVGL